MFVPLAASVAPLVAAAAAGAAAPNSLINLVPLILAIPLAGFVFTAFFGRRIGRPAFVLPLLGVTATWLLSMAVVYQALTGGFGENGAGITLYRWIPAGAFTVDVGFFVDQLTACLLIVVTTIGMVVHLYSVGYMAHDPGRWRFFAYLNLFMFSMLLLVLADNFLVVFAGWELVGLSSYLLIGFWYPRRIGRAGGQEGVHREPRRRRRLRARDHADLGLHGHPEHARGVRPDRGPRPRDDPRRSRCSSSAARSARAPSSRSTSGCRTRWRARRRSRP